MRRMDDIIQPGSNAAVREDDDACWVCGGPTDRRHCKIVCLNCGFTRDCSDP